MKRRTRHARRHGDPEKKKGISFRLAVHHFIPDLRIVEILIDGDVAGVIYPRGDDAIRIASAHMVETNVEDDFAGEVVIDDGTRSSPPIPAVFIRFEPSPYTIVDGRIVKMKAN